MRMKRFLRLIILPALAFSLSSELSHATVTTVAWYRLGENDPGAAHGLMATNSLDVVIQRVLTLVGGPTYVESDRSHG